MYNICHSVLHIAMLSRCEFLNFCVLYIADNICGELKTLMILTELFG